MFIDTKDLGTIKGFDVRAGIVPDNDVSVSDYDCYDQPTIDAYGRGCWSYVGLIVTASRDGIELGSASLWGCEYGDMPGVIEWVSPLSHIDDDYSDVIDEAIAAARESLAKLIAGATDLASA